MSDLRPLSYSHHRVAQVVAPVGWRAIRVEGRTLFTPPAEGRASVWAELWGAYGVGTKRPKRAKVRLVRHKPSGNDQTGLDALVIPPVGRVLEKTYTWNGHVQPDWPLSFEIWPDQEE